VNAELASLDDIEDLLNPYLAAIVALQGTPSDKTTIMDGKNNSVKERTIVGIEWTVNEDTAPISG